MNNLQEMFNIFGADAILRKTLLQTLIEKAGRDSTGAFGMSWEPNLAKELNYFLKTLHPEIVVYNTALCDNLLTKDEQKNYKTKNGLTLFEILNSLKKKKKQTFVDFSAADFFVLNTSTFEIIQTASVKTKSNSFGDVFVTNDTSNEGFTLISEMLNPSINFSTDESIVLNKLNVGSFSIGTVLCFQIIKKPKEKYCVKCFFFDDSLWTKFSKILSDKENYKYSYDPNNDFVIEIKNELNKFEYFVKITNRNKKNEKKSSSHDRGIKVNQKFIDKFFTHFHTTADEIDFSNLKEEIKKYYNCQRINNDYTTKTDR